MPINTLPKADMHVHLEGTMTPAMVEKIAARNGLALPPGLLSGDGAHFHWHDDGTPQGALVSFLKAYDDATGVMKKAVDYTDITYDYLTRVAAEGCIYAELIISADHGALVGISYPEMVGAIAEGYERAKKETGIEARFLSAAVRHYGPEKALAVGETTARYPHPLVTGFTIAGDENAGTFKDFLPAFEASGLKSRNAHAGEAAGPESVRAARDVLGVRRFGHMVRAEEDAALMQELKTINAVAEICVSSNLATKIYKDYSGHPLRRFFDAGLKVVLGSDDPSFFNTSIGREYEIAHKHFGFTEAELLKITQNAIEEAFVDEVTRGQLMERLVVVSNKNPADASTPAKAGVRSTVVRPPL